MSYLSQTDCYKRFLTFLDAWDQEAIKCHINPEERTIELFGLQRSVQRVRAQLENLDGITKIVSDESNRSSQVQRDSDIITSSGDFEQLMPESVEHAASECAPNVMNDWNVKVRKLVQELVEMEEEYIRRLQLLHSDMYLRILEKNKEQHFLPDEVLQQLFINVEDIHKFHSKDFLPQLQDRLENWFAIVRTLTTNVSFENRRHFTCNEHLISIK